MARSNITIKINDSALKQLERDLNKKFNDEIQKEMRRRQPTTRRETERAVLEAAKRVPNFKLDARGAKSIVDQWEAKRAS